MRFNYYFVQYLTDLLPEFGAEKSSTHLVTRHVDAGIHDLDIRHWSLIQWCIIWKKFVKELITRTSLENNRKIRYFFVKKHLLIWWKLNKLLQRPWKELTTLWITYDLKLHLVFFALLLIWRSLRWLPNVFLDFTKKKETQKAKHWFSYNCSNRNRVFC